MRSIRVLFVEDDATLGKVLSRELMASGFDVRHLPSSEGAMAVAREFLPDVALVDLKLPGRGGLELLVDLRAEIPNLQVVMLTGHGGVAEAVDAMRKGAYDFLVKPTRLDVLEQVLQRAAEKTDLLAENERLRRTATMGERIPLIGVSPQMEEIRRLIARIGPTGETVLVTGESGTGKELIARSLHQVSRRRDQPCVVVNCASIPETLIDSELFGHERGAFSGADRRKEGLFASAHGGTLVLDEIGELPLESQPALLRAIQFGEIRPVGSTKTLMVDVRIIGVTNRDLTDEVREKRFREDLYFRLATFQIHAPPLRERRGDIEELARRFLDTACRRAGRTLMLSREACASLSRHEWRGNIRELENMMTRLAVLAEGEVISDEDIAAIGVRQDPRPPKMMELPTLRVAELERIAMLRALEKHSGDKHAAAAELGVSLRTLYNKLKEQES